MGKSENCSRCYFLGFRITVAGDCSLEIKRRSLLGRKAMTNLDSILKKQRNPFTNKCPSSQSYDFSSSHVLMWEFDCKESWVLKNWCFWTMVLEKILESPLDCKEIQPVHPKGWRCVSPVSLCLPMMFSLCVCFCVSSSSKDTSRIGLAQLHLNWLHLQQPYSKQGNILRY